MQKRYTALCHICFISLNASKSGLFRQSLYKKYNTEIFDNVQINSVCIFSQIRFAAKTPISFASLVWE